MRKITRYEMMTALAQGCRESAEHDCEMANSRAEFAQLVESQRDTLTIEEAAEIIGVEE